MPLMPFVSLMFGMPAAIPSRRRCGSRRMSHTRVRVMTRGVIHGEPGTLPVISLCILMNRLSRSWCCGINVFN